MPAKSKDQFHLMAAAEHNPAFAQKVGIKPSVAADFVDKSAPYASLPKKVPPKKKKHMFSKHPVSKGTFKV